MSFAFEVKETDLLGRVGELKVGNKRLETPYMFPVIHPVSQSVSPADLKAMGFGGVMTNSYILRSRKRAEAIEEGVHRLVGFDGMVMTDSGGYQVLEYGDLGVGYAEMASFQAEIGSDIAVTLDRPTGYPQERRVARETMEYSLRNALATLKEYGARETVWVGPVQGGLCSDLVKKSASSMSDAGFGFLALGSPTQVMENYMFADLVRMVNSAKKAMPYSTPLHLFGAGHPLTMALAVALGCDTFDSASYILFARAGRYMTRGGVLTFSSMKHLPCSCPVCSRTTLRELREVEQGDLTKALSVHNLYVLREELEACKEAISEGRLWDLVEERSMSHPRLREAFAEFAKHGEFMAEGTPALKDKGLFIRSAEDLARPELWTARARLKSSVRRSATKAVVIGEGGMDSSRKKGGSRKNSERADMYLLNQALGPYPAELEFVYPFTQTITMETGREKTVKEARVALRKLGYGKVTVESANESRVRVRSRPSRRAASPSPP